MIIDFHTHVFPDKIASATINKLANNSGSKPSTDGTVKGLLDALTRANADIAVALPVLTKPTQFDSVLNFAISVNEQFKDCKKRIITGKFLYTGDIRFHGLSRERAFEEIEKLGQKEIDVAIVDGTSYSPSKYCAVTIF